MAKFSGWINRTANGVLENLIANVLLIAIPAVGAGLISLYGRIPESTILAILSGVVVVDTGVIVLLIRRQAKLTTELRAFESTRDVSTIRAPGLAGQKDDQGLLRAISLMTQFPITRKEFDDKSSPQQILVGFKNQSSDLIHITRVTYSGNSLGLGATALADSYQKDKLGRFVIPLALNSADVQPGRDLVIGMELGAIWARDKIMRHAGNWGYLHVDVEYLGQRYEQVQYSI